MRIIDTPMRAEALYVARNLREIDQRELWASEGRTPFYACMEAFRHSDICIGIAGDDERMVGLAGALRRDDALARAALAPDVAGFRSAVCSGGRAQALQPALLQQLAAAMREAQAPVTCR